LRNCLIFLCLGLAGCSVTPSHGAISFVINQQVSAKVGSAPGKSYDVKVASYALHGTGALRTLVIEAGSEKRGTGYVKLEAQAAGSDPLEKLIGKELKLNSGTIRLPNKTIQLNQGLVILQALSSSFGRGSFNARDLNQSLPWEAIGSFEALAQ
jgi:hypothetical protein